MSIRMLVPIGVLALTLCCESVQAQSPGMPLSSSSASTQLQGKTGSIRSSAIAQVAPFLKADLTARETADILGTASELREAARANAILSIARAKKLSPLGAEAALMLKGATGSNRSMAIAEIAPYLKIGLTGQETADILGTASELSEAARANAILSIARAKKLGPLGAEAALMLKGATGNNRSMAMAEIAPYLKIGLTGQETADILGTVDELNETPRANAILFIARAGKTMPGLTEGELAPVLAGMTGSNRALALSELRVSASHTASSGVPAIRPPTPQVSPAVQPLPTAAAPPAASGLSQPVSRPNGTSSSASTAAGPSPPPSGVSEVLSAEERARLNDAIKKRLRHLVQTPQPPYLFAPITFFDNVNIAITGNTTRRQQYDAYYFASLDYRLLAVKRLTNARALLLKSKRAAVEKSIAESDRYARMMATSYDASLDAYNSNLDAAEAKAKAVYELSKTAAICGATPLGPAATKLFETTFIVADFGVDWVEGGLSNAVKEQLREIVITETLNHLGVKNRCANLLASNGLSFNLPGRLRAVVSSPEFKKSLQGIVAASLASAIRGDPGPLVDLIVIQMNGQEARPLRQLDPADTRSVSSALDFALLSKDVYSVQRSDTVNNTLRKLGGQIWVLHEVYESASLTKAFFGGLRAALYVNAKTNKCVVVFAGTGLTDITDWVNNARQVMGIVPTEYRDGANFAAKAAASCDQDMVLAGHSLGGGIAQYAYLKTGERYRTFTFNPAGLAATNLDYQSANLRTTNVESFIAQAYDPSSGTQLGRDVASLTGVTLGREILVPVYSWLPTTHFIDVLVEGLGVQRSYCRLCR